MATEAAKKFYDSTTWRECRKAYIKAVRGLCERCLANGLYVPGEVVHHKTYINAENITDPQVLTDFNNLELLCRRCHEQEHGRNLKRYTIDESGKVVV